MKRPTTLFARLLWILLGGLAASQALTFALVLGERSGVMRGMMVSYLATDLASSVAMLDRLPPTERAAWLPRLQRGHYQLRLGPPVRGAAGANGGPEAATRPDITAPPEAARPDTSELGHTLVLALGQALAQPVQAWAPALPGQPLRLGLALRDGTPLWVQVAEPRLRLSPWVLGALGLQAVALAALCWWAVRQVTRPLTQLARAVDGLQPDQRAAPLPEAGPREVAQAAAAFNQMRQRIDAHGAERLQMLAAISHDLQTPITRMRLRAELLADPALRDKLQADLGQMQHLVAQGLAYARTDQAPHEPEARTDLNALLHSLAADYQDAGQPVHWDGGPACTVLTRPQALARLLGNLVDNALKFGGAAELVLSTAPGVVALQVLDRGPGIPPEELARVLQPFYRIEGSRNRSTGGTGLGLAIVQQLAPACRAQLSLAPRPGGGLVASLRWGDAPAATTPTLA